MRRATQRVLAGLVVALALSAGCARGTIDGEDTGTGAPDAGDTSVRDTAVGMDAPRDTSTSTDTSTPTDTATPMDRAVPMDTAMGTDVVMSMDVPVDTAMPPRDVPVPVDTAVARCPSTCSSDNECQTMCPAAPAGNVNCCLPGAGGGTCYVNSGGSCPAPMPDSGVPDTGGGGGGPGDLCSSDSQCSTGGANCCSIISGSFGVCACSVPLFGCSPIFCM